jgi:hypothetical protein
MLLKVVLFAYSQGHYCPVKPQTNSTVWGR